VLLVGNHSGGTVIADTFVFAQAFYDHFGPERQLFVRRGAPGSTIDVVPDREHTRFCVVSPRDVHSAPQMHGDMLTAISEGLVSLLKEFYGRGPTRAKTYFEDDLVVCLLRGGFSRVEQTLLEGGRGSSVIQQRMEFQDLMRERFERVIEAATGRRVIGFMSGNQQDPDIMCEVFVLAPTDLVDDHEIAGSGASFAA
jgi:uncharacterized protein YbcI